MIPYFEELTHLYRGRSGIPASIYDVRTEGGGGKKIPHICEHFADDIYGSPPCVDPRPAVVDLLIAEAVV